MGRGFPRHRDRELKALDPKSVIFYTSGRASLETSYLYALFARLYGNNNLPDSSNMCHETTSVGAEGGDRRRGRTVVFDDLSNCDAIFFFGQNTGSNSPRFLHPLQDAAKRGVQIITFNPVREKGLETFVNPQNPSEMLTGKETRISSQYHQVRAGGDIAVMLGICKHVFAADDQAKVGRQARARHAPSSSSTPTASRRSRPRFGIRHGTRSRPYRA